MLTLDELEEILNAPWYKPPSQRGGGNDSGLGCPYCGGTNTYYSGLFQAWQCNGCDGLFSLEESVSVYSDIEEEL